MLSDKTIRFLLRIGRLLPYASWRKACRDRLRTYSGKGNQVILIYPDGQRHRCPFSWLPYGSAIKFQGDRNTLELEVPSSSPKVIKHYLKAFGKLSYYFYGDDNCCHFGVTKNYRWFQEGSTVILHNGAKMQIGRDFAIGPHAQLYANGLDNAEFTIGDASIVAGESVVRNDDAHTIFDDKTEQILNRPRGVHIGNHVWITFRCLILKGTCLPDNCVIACGTTCTKEFTEPNTIIGGAPPRILRRGINWSILSISEYQEQQEQNIAEIATTDIDENQKV